MNRRLGYTVTNVSPGPVQSFHKPFISCPLIDYVSTRVGDAKSRLRTYLYGIYDEGSEATDS